MLQKKIIGLIGAKAAGKTTAFNVINVTITNVTEVTLAGKLKSVCAEVFDIPYDHFNSHRYKEAELDNLVYLNSENLAEVLKAYGIKVS